MFRKIFILAISLLFAVTFIGCSSSKTSQPEQIDVIELPLHDAYSKLNKEGWGVTTADDTLYSGTSQAHTKTETRATPIRPLRESNPTLPS